MKGILILILCISVQAYCQPIDCSLKKQSEGIRVYTCKAEHEQFKTLKAEFIIKNTSMVELKNFLMHVENYPTWQYNMMHAEVIQKISDNEISYLSHINAPWPVEDREMVVNLRVLPGLTDHQIHIEMNTLQTDRPVANGFLRVPFMHGRWTVKEVQNNSLQAEYILQIDPGGTIPAWLVNLAMAEGPYVSFRNLKKQLEK